MKKTLMLVTMVLSLNACAYTQTSIKANNGGVFGAIGSSYRW